MSKYSLADLKYISTNTLKSWFREGSPSGKFAVVDVRDDDFIGGHIKNCYHYPANKFVESIPDLQKRLLDNGINDVVFHCALSQVRGPSATLKFLRANNESSNDELKVLRVYVLKGGFTRWQQDYGEDSEVTEGYNKELWKSGY